MVSVLKNLVLLVVARKMGMLISLFANTDKKAEEYTLMWQQLKQAMNVQSSKVMSSTRYDTFIL